MSVALGLALGLIVVIGLTLWNDHLRLQREHARAARMARRVSCPPARAWIRKNDTPPFLPPPPMMAQAEIDALHALVFLEERRFAKANPIAYWHPPAPAATILTAAQQDTARRIIDEALGGSE